MAPKAAPIAPAAPAAPAAAAAIAQMDWPALQAAVASCTACPLAAGCRQSVFGAGHPQARWMIVGETPGEQEDRQGQPFVGLLRSEERRVGKECRSRWSPYH